jgi:hypothetical protein
MEEGGMRRDTEEGEWRRRREEKMGEGRRRENEERTREFR